MEGNHKCVLYYEWIRMIQEGTNPYFVKKLETDYVEVGDHQHFRGYTLFLYQEHVADLFDIRQEIRAKHLEKMTLVAESCFTSFRH